MWDVYAIPGEVPVGRTSRNGIVSLVCKRGWPDEEATTTCLQEATTTSDGTITNDAAEANVSTTQVRGGGRKHRACCGTAMMGANHARTNAPFTHRFQCHAYEDTLAFSI